MTQYEDRAQRTFEQRCAEARALYETDDRLRTIVEMRTAGETYAAIAARVGMTTSGVQHHWERYTGKRPMLRR